MCKHATSGNLWVLLARTRCCELDCFLYAHLRKEKSRPQAAFDRTYSIGQRKSGLLAPHAQHAEQAQAK